MLPGFYVFFALAPVLVVPAVMGTYAWARRKREERKREDLVKNRDRDVAAGLRDAVAVPTANVTDAREIAIEGLVEASAGLLRAPLSGDECVAFRITVNGVVVENQSTDFLVHEAANTYALVRAANDLSLRVGRVNTSTLWHEAWRAPLDKYVQTHDLVRGTEKVEAVEHLVPVGVRVKVSGLAARELVAGTDANDYRGRTTRVVFEATPEKPLLLEEVVEEELE